LFQPTPLDTLTDTFVYNRRVNPIRSTFLLFRAAYQQWSDDNVADLAAALAYYALVSIVPLIVLFIAGVGIIFGEATTRHEIQRQIAAVAGTDIAQFVADVAAAARRSSNILAAWLSTSVTVLVAIGLFNHLRTSIDHMWRVPARPSEPFWKNFIPNIALFLMVLAISLLLLVTAFLSTILTVSASRLVDGNILIKLLNIPLLFLLGTFFFTAIYYLLPSKKLPARELIAGAAVTSLLFTLGRLLIGFYFTWQNPASIYGGASAVVALLLWVYYSAQIFYFGVEFTYVYARRKGVIK
jgi:membrane protein